MNQGLRFQIRKWTLKGGKEVVSDPENFDVDALYKKLFENDRPRRGYVALVGAEVLNFFDKK